MDIEIVQLVTKIACIYIATHFGLVNLCKLKYGHPIAFGNFAYMATGITGFVTLQFLI